MSILIKGIDLPKDYWYLDLVITADGVVRYYGDEDVQIAKAVELPDHGDLVDREELAKDLGITDFDCDKCGWHKETPFPYCSAELDDACFALENAEVVIPAERSEASLCDNCDWKNEKGCSWCKRMERSEDATN